MIFLVQHQILRAVYTSGRGEPVHISFISGLQRCIRCLPLREQSGIVDGCAQRIGFDHGGFAFHRQLHRDIVGIRQVIDRHPDIAGAVLIGQAGEAAGVKRGTAGVLPGVKLDCHLFINGVVILQCKPNYGIVIGVHLFVEKIGGLACIELGCPGAVEQGLEAAVGRRIADIAVAVGVALRRQKCHRIAVIVQICIGHQAGHDDVLACEHADIGAG